MGATAYERHVLERSIVLPELRVLFLPVPKAGCTSILWLLAELAGMDAELFSRSARPEVSRAMAVHDMSLWRPEHRLAHYDDDARAELLAAEGWLRFAVVRDPRTRLWSSWQSKLLMREPRFADAFGDEPWFPRVPRRPADLVDDFRTFVEAVGDGRAHDVHWAPQTQLTEQLALDHVGRVEQLQETIDVVLSHAGAAHDRDLAPANTSVIAMPRAAYDDAAAAVLQRVFRSDFAAYGYDPDVTGIGADRGEWEASVEAGLAGVRTAIEHSRRVGELHRIAERRGQRAHAAHRRLQELGAGRGAAARGRAIANLEGAAEYDARWSWDEGMLQPGLTAVLRVRDEARCLPWTLPPLLRAVGHVTLIDNGSTDGTPELAAAIARREGAGDRITIHDYPFAVARCGDEHLRTPAASVHSLVHFYNWSFAQVRTSYALKWDGDMVLTEAAVATLRDLAWQLEAAEVVIKVPRYPLYVADERRAFIDTGMCNCEAWGWPNRPGYQFVKALDWELPLWGGDPGVLALPDWSCVEVKHLDADEFAHWSHTEFESSARTQRKRREWDVFRALRAGADLPDGVEAIEAPPGSHVVAHVREAWLPERAVSDGSPRPRSRAASRVAARAG
jgi:Sulfotransferase family